MRHGKRLLLCWRVVLNKDELCNIGAESGIVATLVHNPNFYYFSEGLMPKHFYDVSNGCFYEAIYELLHHGIDTIDAFNIYECIQNKETLRKRAEGASVDRIKEFIESSGYLARSSVEEYKMLVKSVMNFAFKREMLDTLHRCERFCLDKNDDDDIQKKIYSNIDSVLLDYASSETVKPFKDVADDCWNEIENRQKDGGGIPFDTIPELNKYVTMSPGDLVLFGGRPKEGKSIMMLNIAVALMKRGKAPLYIDSEIRRLINCTSSSAI